MTPDPPRIAIADPDYFARLHHRLRARLPMWVIFTPMNRDYPGLWVARMCVTLPEPKPTRFVITHHNLIYLRKILPPGLMHLSRSRGDQPNLEEIWL